MDYRDRINMTGGEFSCTAAAILLLGVLTGWGLFSRPGLMRDLALDSGSLADWLAAAGTWVIGYGAWKYARANHEHHVRLAVTAELRELNARMTALTSFIALLGRANAPTFAFNAADKLKRGWASKAHETVAGILEITGKIQWDSVDRNVLDVDTLTHFTLCEIEMQRFTFVAESTLSKIKEAAALSEEEAEGLVLPLRPIAKAITDQSEFVRKFVNAERRRIYKQTKVLERNLSPAVVGNDG